MQSLSLRGFSRLLPIALLALAVQRVVFASFSIADVKVQFVLALVVAAGAAGGSDRGAVAGFVLGLLVDLSGNTPVGLVALAYGLGGMTAGYVLTLAPDAQWFVQVLFAGLGAAVGEAAIPAIDVIAGNSGWMTSDLFVEIPVVAAAAMLFAPALMWPGRWMMGVKRKKWKAIPE